MVTLSKFAGVRSSRKPNYHRLLRYLGVLGLVAGGTTNAPNFRKRYLLPYFSYSSSILQATPSALSVAVKEAIYVRESFSFVGITMTALDSSILLKTGHVL
jgi:hypothetical protein